MLTEQQYADVFVGPPAPTSDTSWIMDLNTMDIPLEGGGSFNWDPRSSGAYWEDKQQTSWLTSLTKPFSDFGGKLLQQAKPVIAGTYEKLPEVLWGVALERAGVIDRPKQIPVDEGAGVNVIHTQPAHPGGEPAKPYQPVVPMYSAIGQAKTGDIPISYIVIGLIALFILAKGK